MRKCKVNRITVNCEVEGRWHEKGQNVLEMAAFDSTLVFEEGYYTF